MDTEIKSIVHLSKIFLKDGSRETPEGTRLNLNVIVIGGENMKLVYRGVSYDYNPPQVAVEESAVTGKFRGLDWRFHNLKKPLVLQPPVNLTYRGVAYNNRPTSTQEPATTAANIKEQARYRLLRKEKAIHNRVASMSLRTAHELGIA